MKEEFKDSTTNSCEGNGLCFSQATVLDPQRAAVEQAMKSLGHASVKDVRVGKTITFEIDADETAETSEDRGIM